MKPIPASVLRVVASGHHTDNMNDVTGLDHFMSVRDLAAYALRLQEAARDLCASLHADAHGATASECYDRLRALLPEGE